MYLITLLSTVYRQEERRLTVAPDSSMSLTDENELEDSEIACSTSPEPDISYGKFLENKKINTKMSLFLSKRMS